MKARITSGRLRLRNGNLALTAAPAVGGGVAATSLTLTDVAKDQMGFQRVGTSKNIFVGGTSNGSAAQVRVINAAGGAAVTDWVSLPVNGGTYGGLVTVPQGATQNTFYKWQVRDSVSTDLTVTGSNKFGVGAFGLEFGQSNMANFPPAGGPLYPNGAPGAIEYNRAGNFVRIGNINDAYPPNTPYSVHTANNAVGNRGDGYVYLANLLGAGLGVPIFIIERAVGGTFMSSWVPGGHNWNPMIAALNACGGDAEFAIYYQGENDAAAMTKAARKSNLALIHDGLKAQTGRDNDSFKFGLISLSVGSYSGSLEGDFGKIRTADVEWASSTPGAFLAACMHDTQTTDGVHVNAEGHSRMGRRVARSLLAARGIGVSASGPRITGATRSGTAVTISLAHSGGTALTDGAGGAGAALTGFEFKDAGAGDAVIGYSATSISGNTVTLALASSPVGALSMSYAMMNVPHAASATAAPVLASCVYDNVPILNSAIGCPLQPCAAITVTGS